jgi:hypothetical protein
MLQPNERAHQLEDDAALSAILPIVGRVGLPDLRTKQVGLARAVSSPAL